MTRISRIYICYVELVLHAIICLSERPAGCVQASASSCRTGTRRLRQRWTSLPVGQSPFSPSSASATTWSSTCCTASRSPRPKHLSSAASMPSSVCPHLARAFNFVPFLAGPKAGSSISAVPHDQPQVPGCFSLFQVSSFWMDLVFNVVRTGWTHSFSCHVQPVTWASVQAIAGACPQLWMTNMCPDHNCHGLL